MLRKIILPNILLLSSIPLLLGADVSTSPVNITAAQIVDKNVQARGGLAAWRAVGSLSMSGKLEAGGTQNIELPFVLEMQRPRKARVELKFNGQTAVQVYDGLNGWKLRPFLNRHQVEPFTADEMEKASQQQDLDGPLIDYAAKGTEVELEGIEPVDGHDAYKLKLTLKNSEVRRVWVDAETFLDVEIDGTRRLDGSPHSMATYMRDYRSVQGLKVAYLLETSVEGVKQTERIRIENVTVNPKLESSRFAKPE